MSNETFNFNQFIQDSIHSLTKPKEYIARSNTYHTLHMDDFNCQVCHSQNYNNCGSCHIHGDEVKVPAYMDYKIALNPNGSLNFDIKI